jgi:3',5'-cyclic AMP phosphodiesterase CpdA
MVFVKPTPPENAATLVHLSDFHLCRTSGASPRAFRNKRILSYISWCLRRRRDLRPEILADLCRAVRRLAADLIVVTGDLTHLGLPAEFRRVHTWLGALGRPQEVFVVPGNHDSLVAECWQDTFLHWADYMAGDASALPQSPCHPTLRRVGPLAVIGISTAQPSALFQAIGRIGTRQLDRVSELLRETAKDRRFRVILTHHPPTAQTASGHKRLKDAAAFRAVVERDGAELILHGHAHRRTRFDLRGPSGPVPTLGISAASAASRQIERRAAFRVFRIAGPPEARRTSVQDHVRDPAGGGFVPGPEEPLLTG